MFYSRGWKWLQRFVGFHCRLTIPGYRRNKGEAGRDCNPIGQGLNRFSAARACPRAILKKITIQILLANFSFHLIEYIIDSRCQFRGKFSHFPVFRRPGNQINRGPSASPELWWSAPESSIPTWEYCQTGDGNIGNRQTISYKTRNLHGVKSSRVSRSDGSAAFPAAIYHAGFDSPVGAKFRQYPFGVILFEHPAPAHMRAGRTADKSDAAVSS